ncbi:cold-shock protein [Mesorhizobium sp. M4A.F.Ca.ET.029.04.2.1]|nr:cold-shock protein [Mesorhizobium sp. M4A.F.Ca.ET.029.04.2.1]
MHGSGGATGQVFGHLRGHPTGSSAVERSGLSTLADGQKVNYEIEQDRRTGKSSAGNLSKVK